MRRKSLKSGLLTVILVITLILGVRIFDATRFDMLQGRPMIIDGDSLVLAGRRVRLLGLDAPELAQMCQAGGSDKACGTMARRALREIIGGQVVHCEIDGEDRYERLLARCFLGGGDIGDMLVGAGWAVATDDYALSEADARAAGAGIWSMQFMEPADWRELNAGVESSGGIRSWLRD